MKLILAFICTHLAALALAQDAHFVYLQTENLAPFYIQTNGKTISSTASGYLILGKLKDSTYPIKLGLVGSSDVQEYMLKVEGRNSGFLVKQVKDMGWGIQDLQTQTMQLSMAFTSEPPTPPAKVSHSPVSRPDSSIQSPKIVAGFYIDTAALQSDAPPPDTMATPTKVADTVSAAAADAVPVVASPVAAIVIEKPPVVKPEVTAPTDTLATKPIAAFERQPCMKIIGRQEVEEIILQQNGVTDLNTLVSNYKTAFTDKCITVANIRKIASTLASDVAKYRLLETAYPFALDYYEYKKLANLIQDSYYLSLFNKLTNP